MATESIKIIDPGQGTGHDYHNLIDWEAGEQADLPTNDRIAVAKCRCTDGTADTYKVTIAGWTTDATRYIKIWTDPAESYRHNGTWQTGNKYRLECIGVSIVDAYITPAEEYIKILGIQMQMTPTTGSYTSCLLNDTVNTSSSLLEVGHCIAKLVCPDNAETYGMVTRGSNVHCTLFYNNIVLDVTATSGDSCGLGLSGNGSSAVCKAYNNTIVN